MDLDMLYDVVVCGMVLVIFYAWAIRSIFKNRTKFISTDFTSEPQRTPHMNRTSELYPEDEVIDVYWEVVYEESERGWKKHHQINAVILILIAIYFLSDWISKFIVWLVFSIT